jgi:hypothetical protein
MPSDRAIVPTRELGGDRHLVGLWRLSAVSQYLYDTMAGGTSIADGPLPLMAMEKVREAQEAIDDAIRLGRRARPAVLGGEMQLVEDWAAVSDGDDG